MPPVRNLPEQGQHESPLSFGLVLAADERTGTRSLADRSAAGPLLLNGGIMDDDIIMAGGQILMPRQFLFLFRSRDSSYCSQIFKTSIRLFFGLLKLQQQLQHDPKKFNKK